MKILRLLALTVTSLLFAGCVTTTPVDSPARTLCVQMFGTDAFLKVLWLPTSHVEAFTMAFLGNSGPQLEIAIAMESAEKKRVDLVVWTEPSGQSTYYIEQALRYVPRDERLDSLNFLFVGDAPDADHLRPEIEATGAKFYFHQR
jgi:hypothetical protein